MIQYIVYLQSFFLFHDPSLDLLKPPHLHLLRYLLEWLVDNHQTSPLLSMSRLKLKLPINQVGDPSPISPTVVTIIAPPHCILFQTIQKLSFFINIFLKKMNSRVVGQTDAILVDKTDILIKSQHPRILGLSNQKLHSLSRRYYYVLILTTQ